MEAGRARSGLLLLEPQDEGVSRSRGGSDAGAGGRLTARVSARPSRGEKGWWKCSLSQSGVQKLQVQGFLLKSPSHLLVCFAFLDFWFAMGRH